MKTTYQALITLTLIICFAIASPPAAFAQNTSNLQLITLPVRVFRFTSDQAPKLNCSLSDDEIRAQFVAVNETWTQAGIVWQIESIVDHEAKAPAAFFNAMTSQQRRGLLAPAMVANLKGADLLKGGFNVAIAEDYGKRMGGVFISAKNGLVFYAKHGIKGEQTPAVLAHELGHALGLPHTIFEKNNNLMMGSGPSRVPTRTKPITESQIKIARRIALTGSPSSPPAIKAPASSPAAIFKLLDTNSDGAITTAEAKPKHQLYASEFLRNASRAPSDSLTRKQYDFIIQQRQGGSSGGSGGAGFGPEIVPQIFSRFDKNNDDQITRQEANDNSSLVNEYFDLWDLDKNDILTKDEITTSLTMKKAVRGALRAAPSKK